MVGFDVEPLTGGAPVVVEDCPLVGGTAVGDGGRVVVEGAPPSDVDGIALLPVPTPSVEPAPSPVAGVDGVLSVVDGTLPVVDGTLPVVDGTLPVVDGTLPVVEGTSPVVDVPAVEPTPVVEPVVDGVLDGAAGADVVCATGGDA